MEEFKTPTGRLREAGARRILELRGEKKTYLEIATALQVSVGTVFNVAKRRTWKWIA